ncbi:U-box-domain-containing protein [Hypoxylon rubiginosum]|uniref:U-box-domain-containing protein n=1 Tax=Hypoxylon rubiginosum TaxID=110542 RepID=A0ACC0CZA1_9PEZI|nr:U-box-domain-containing protein [Hypoxylon rubiginosum]
MDRDPERAEELKNEGNAAFKAKNFIAAESLYSKAIIANSRIPSLYTNRAMARLNMGFYDSAIADCKTSLRLNPVHLKGYFILSQCQLSIGDGKEALQNALKGHQLCAESNDKSLGLVTQQVLRCKKELWDQEERRRLRETGELENELLGLMSQQLLADRNSCHSKSEREQVTEEYGKKMALLQSTFEKARASAEKKREVPDWAIDEISFAVMIDPVMTKSGKSYERASIMEHLSRYQNDPITREPLTPKELRPNLQLKEACAEFLEKNGWAADW